MLLVTCLHGFQQELCRQQGSVTMSSSWTCLDVSFASPLAVGMSVVCISSLWLPWYYSQLASAFAFLLFGLDKALLRVRNLTTDSAFQSVPGLHQFLSMWLWRNCTFSPTPVLPSGCLGAFLPGITGIQTELIDSHCLASSPCTPALPSSSTM